MASRIRTPVKTGSDALRRPRCHLSQVRWPLRVMKSGSVMSGPMDDAAVAIGGDGRGGQRDALDGFEQVGMADHRLDAGVVVAIAVHQAMRSEEHTSELQSLMRI